MAYETDLTGEQVTTSVKNSDITVSTIAERNLLNTNLFKVGKVCHVADIGDGTSDSYTWDGMSFVLLAYNKIRFDTNNIPTLVEGDVGWDSESQTLSVGMDGGSTLSIGEEMYIRATNVQGSTIQNGQVVYVTGASAFETNVALSNASNVIAIKTIGIATQTVLPNESGLFTTNGIVKNINTSSWAEGSSLYLSTTDGMVTNIEPPSPNYSINLGYVIRQHVSLGRILVKILPVSKLASISDVVIPALTNGDQIYYNSATSTWENIEAGFIAVSRWDDIILSPESLGTGSSAPDLITFVGGTRTYGFNGSNTMEQLYGSFEVPHAYREGTDLRPHIHWTPTTTGLGNVKWQMEYAIASINTTFPTTTTIISAVDSAGGIANQNLASEFDIISGIGIEVGTVCRFRLFRDPTDIEDTYTGDAGLVSLGIHYEIDGDGSRLPFSK